MSEKGISLQSYLHGTLHDFYPLTLFVEALLSREGFQARIEPLIYRTKQILERHSQRFLTFKPFLTRVLRTHEDIEVNEVK